MIHKNDLDLMYNRYVRGGADQDETELIRLRIVEKLAEDGQRHILCRFIAQLVIEDEDIAAHFTQTLGLTGMQHNLRKWCFIALRMSSSSPSVSQASLEFCDALEEDDKILNDAVRRMKVSANSMFECEHGVWEPTEEGMCAVRENLEMAIVSLGHKLPEYSTE